MTKGRCINLNYDKTAIEILVKKRCLIKIKDGKFYFLNPGRLRIKT